MARVCIANRRLPTRAASTALLLASVSLEPVASLESDTLPSLEVEASSIEEQLEGNENNIQFKQILVLASKLPVLDGIVTQTKNLVASYESGPLHEAAVAYARDGEVAEESYKKHVAEWAEIRFPKGLFSSLDEVLQFYNTEFVVGSTNQLAESALSQMKDALIATLADHDHYPEILAELHKLDSSLKMITLEQIEAHKNRFQNFMKMFMQKHAQTSSAAQGEVDDNEEEHNEILVADSVTDDVAKEDEQAEA